MSLSWTLPGFRRSVNSRDGVLPVTKVSTQAGGFDVIRIRRPT